ncbi:hypothetical protein HY091_00220 [Candidatus Kaiserbacteria bacterium]|nr:hypothetical protein [Candidatus Kaiserbacteria bacterium]
MAIKVVIFSGSVLAGVHQAENTLRVLAEKDISSIILGRPEDIDTLAPYTALGRKIHLVLQKCSQSSEHYFDAAFRLMSKERPGVKREHFVYVGDCSADIMAANKAGLYFGIVFGGDENAVPRGVTPAERAELLRHVGVESRLIQSARFIAP